MPQRMKEVRVTVDRHRLVLLFVGCGRRAAIKDVRYSLHAMVLCTDRLRATDV